MKAFVFAAGYGMRMRPLTDELAKPAMPFFGRPIIAHTLAWLARHGVGSVIINLHHLPETVRSATLKHAPLGLGIQFSEEADILGTGGGLALALKHFELEPQLLTVNGDIFTDISLDEPLAAHKRDRPEATLVLNDDPANKSLFGVGITSAGYITDFWGEPAGHEAAAQHLAFTGVGVLSPSLVSHVPPNGYACIKESGYIPALQAKQPLRGRVTSGNWFDLGTPERYLNAHLQMIEKAGELSGLPRRGRYLWTADDIPKHVHLHPPAIVGPGLRAAPGTAIGPAAFLGSNVRLMRNAAVERAVVWDGASVADKVKDCIVSQQNVVSAAVTP